MTRDDNLIRSVSPEAELLFRASRIHQHPENSQAIQRLISSGPDWRRFLASVERNYVAPMVSRTFGMLEADAVPPKVMETLRVRTKITAWRNQEFLTELLRLHEVFHEHGIEVLNYKGPTAAIAFYGGISGRTFNDLDFLVRRSDLDQTMAVLQNEGYSVSDALTTNEAELFEREQKEYLLIRGQFQLEPHWSITARRYPFEIDYEGLWRRAVKLRQDHTDLLVLSPEDDLHVLSVVGAKGKWKRLQQLTDIAECMRAHPEIAWERVSEMAKAAGSERILLLALYLSQALLGAEAPPELLERAASDRNIRRLALSITRSFDQPGQPNRFLMDGAHTFSPMLFSMRERWRDKARYLYRTTTTPTQLHTRRMPLPRPLFFLYRLLVPMHDYLAYPAVSLLKHARSRGALDVESR